MKKESRLVKKIKDYLNSLDNSFFYKTHGNRFQQAGISDLIGCLNGTFVAIEVKTESNKSGVTRLQASFLNTIEKCKGVSFVASSLEDVKERISLLYKA